MIIGNTLSSIVKVLLLLILTIFAIPNNSTVFNSVYAQNINKTNHQMFSTAITNTNMNTNTNTILQLKALFLLLNLFINPSQ